MTNTIDQYLYYIDESYIITEFERLELLAENISIEKLTSVTKSGLLRIEGILTKHTSVSKIKSSAKSVAGRYKSKVMKLQKQGVNPEKAGLEISKEVGRDLKKIILKAKSDFQQLGVGKKIVIALGMFVVLIFLNTFLFTIISSIITNPRTAIAVVSTVIAPLTEETLKLYFIKTGMPWIGTGIVFGIEAIMYIMKMIAAGLSLPQVIIMRVAGLLMHFTTTAIQKTFVEENDALTGWIIAFTVHMLWNSFAIAYNDEFISWAK